jgi:hypothetical protein
LVGEAVKVTEVPAQMVVAEALILTLTGRFGLTVIVILLDKAGFPEAQPAFDVSSHVITSLLASAAVV